MTAPPSTRCPTCKKSLSTQTQAHPFCSERCRMADLGGWLDERFRIRGTAEEDLQNPPGPDSDRED